MRSANDGFSPDRYVAFVARNMPLLTTHGLKMPSWECGLAVPGKSLSWPFSARKHREKAWAFQGSRLPHPATDALIHGLLAWLLASMSFAHAAGTDVIRLTDGDAIHGRVVRQDPDGSLLVITRRGWLTRRLPKLAASAMEAERTRTRQALLDIVIRLDALLAAPPAPAAAPLRFFLTGERSRIRERLAADPVTDYPFLWLSLPAKRMRELRPADPEWQRLVQWGWHEQIADCETLSQRRLTDLLHQRGIDPSQQPPALIEQIPPLPQGEDEWRARMALLEDTFGKPVRFQGTSSLLIRTDEEPGVEVILPMLRASIDRSFTDLLAEVVPGGGAPAAARKNSDAWLAPARSSVANIGHFLATRVDTDPATNRVEVESVFEVRLADATWTRLWTDTVQIDATQPRPDLEARVQEDPRVQQLLATVRALGIADEQLLRTVIRFGAATMDAQETLQSRLAAFRRDHTLRIDAPPIDLPGRSRTLAADHENPPPER